MSQTPDQIVARPALGPDDVIAALSKHFDLSHPATLDAVLRRRIHAGSNTSVAIEQTDTGPVLIVKEGRAPVLIVVELRPNNVGKFT